MDRLVVHSIRADRPDGHHTCPPLSPIHSSVPRRQHPAVVHHRTGVHWVRLVPNSSSSYSTATDGHLVVVHPGRDAVADQHKDSYTVERLHMVPGRDQVLVHPVHRHCPQIWSQWHQSVADLAVAVLLHPMTSSSCCLRILWSPPQHLDYLAAANWAAADQRVRHQVEIVTSNWSTCPALVLLAVAAYYRHVHAASALRTH